MKQIQLLWVYHSRLLPDAGVKSHSHEYFHLLSVHQGSLSFNIGDASFSLKKGDIVIVPKGVSHSFQNSADETALFYEVKFAIFNPTLSQTLLSTGSLIWSDDFSYQLVKHIATEYVYCRTLSDESASAALSTLIFHLTSDVRMTDEFEHTIIDTTGFSPLAKKVVDYLSVHYGESLDLDDISVGIGISKNYMCNAFKRSTGITILECLNMIRIRKAAELIVYSDLSLAHVARMCGYATTSHFNRIFSHYVGIPPGQCRHAYTPDLGTKDLPILRPSDSFMYSVLAGKSISPHIINELEKQANSAKPAN